MIKHQHFLMLLFALLPVFSIHAQAKPPAEINVPGVNGETVFTFQANTPDILMRRVPATTLAQRQKDPKEFIRLLAEYINEKATNDFDKVKKAHDWVALNIKYDAQAYFSGRYSSQDPGAVLKRGLAVCAGYAQVFKMLCDALKIECSIVEGHARGYGRSVFKYENPMEIDHDWNIVTIAGKKYIIDCTWDSGYLAGAKFQPKYVTDYLFVNPEYFIYDHFPADNKNQLLNPPISAEAFDALPFLYPLFFKTVENYQKFTRITEVSADEEYSLELSLKPGYELVYSWYSATTTAGTRIGREVFLWGKDLYQITMPKLKPGNYMLRVGILKTGETRYQYCGEFGFVVK